MKVNNLIMFVMGVITTFALSSFASSNQDDQSLAKKIYDQYIAVKNALVLSDAEKVKEAAKGIIGEITKAGNNSKMSDEEMKTYHAFAIRIKTEAEKITAGSDIEDQRKNFSSLSEIVYNMVKEKGMGTTVYYQHCPMALNNTGGNWLSENKEIRNPYFGARMLKCGSIKESITN